MKHPRAHRIRRIGVLASASALTIATLTTTAAPATAHPASDRAVSAGTGWLLSQLTGGLVHNDQYDFDDLGLTADAAFALHAVGGRATSVEQIADAVAPRVTEWYDYFGTIYTGSAAKAMALAQVAGKDATAFGGQNLQDVVEDTVGAAAPIVGRVQNANETDWQSGDPADSLNVISQSWAARALAVQGSTQADEVESFLLDQQCEGGFFRYGLTADKAASEQGCVPGTDLPHLDTTALVLLNLAAIPSPSVEVAGAIGDAAAWLKAQQAADGSVGGGTEGANANSTGLAGWALGTVGESAAAAQAATWLRGLQVADLAPCGTTLATANGAIAYNAASLDSARANRTIAVAAQDQFRRASAQALPALTYVPAAAGVLAVSAPATAVENSAVEITVSGLGPGEPGCVSLGGQVQQVTGTGAALKLTFQLPGGAAARTFQLTTLAGPVTTTTMATAAPTIPEPEAQVGELGAAKVEKVRDNAFMLAVACPGTRVCAGAVKVRTLRRVELPGGNDRRVLLAKREYAVAPGETTQLRLRVQRPARPVLGSRRLRVVAVQTVRGAEPTSTTFWIRRK